MAEKKKELLDDLFVDLGDIGNISEEKLEELTTPGPLTEEQKYSASVISLANFCKKDLTYILVPKKVDMGEEGYMFEFHDVELNEATTKDLVAWVGYVCPTLDLSGIPELTTKKEKVILFEMVVNYIDQLRRSWLSLNGRLQHK